MIVHGLDQVPEFEDEKEIHLAIGMFDGLHRGHQELINQAITAARKVDGISAVLTFWPHPSRIVTPSNPISTIMPPIIKAEHLEGMGVDLVIQVEFTREFSEISPEMFLKKIIKIFPNLKAIYEGANFRFGYKHEGDIAFLTQFGKKMGFSVIIGKDVEYKQQLISASRIRQALLDGNLNDVNAMLGYNYYSLGMVVEGAKKENKRGFPTLHFVWQPELKPKYGVYAIKVTYKHEISEPGIAYYGVSPAMNQDMEPILEVELFNETAEWGIGDMLKVQWCYFIREEMKFDNVAALDAQIEKDIEKAKELLVV